MSSSKYDSEAIQVEQFQCAGHHFARVTLEIGRWHRVPHHSCFISEEIVGEGVAKRSHKDRNDDYVGDNLALARALASLTHRVAKRAVDKVKHNDDMKAQRAVKKEQRREKIHPNHPLRVFAPTLFQQAFSAEE